jgi:glutathione S-transferase
MQLEMKRVPYRVEKINMNCYGKKSPSFLNKTRRGLLPAIEIDGCFYTESSVIMDLIETKFPDYSPLVPAAGEPLHRTSKQMLELERQLFGAWLYWLRSDSDAAKLEFVQAMNATEDALAAVEGPYFLGDTPSLVDCVFASSLERIAASICYYKGLRIKGEGTPWTKVNCWFHAMETHESYRASQSDFHTHVHDLPPQIGSCLASGTTEQMAAAAEIDGTDGRSWCLPLPPLNGHSLEPPPIGDVQDTNDLIEAAAAMCHCHAGVINSASLATGADYAAVDIAFRQVVQDLLDSSAGTSDTASTGVDTPASIGAALRYTRDRICVPRDMSFTAARQLRAHLNKASNQITAGPVVAANEQCRNSAGATAQWAGIPIMTRSRPDMDPAVFHAAAVGGGGDGAL